MAPVLSVPAVDCDPGNAQSGPSWTAVSGANRLQCETFDDPARGIDGGAVRGCEFHGWGMANDTHILCRFGVEMRVARVRIPPRPRDTVWAADCVTGRR